VLYTIFNTIFNKFMEYTNKHEIIQTLIDKNKDGGYQLLLTNFNSSIEIDKLLKINIK